MLDRVLHVLDGWKHRYAGNDSVAGFIDWDERNGESEYVKVLAGNSRYTLENSIFDPLAVAALLLRKDKKKREKFKLAPTETYKNLPTVSVEKLQAIADAVVEDIAAHAEAVASAASPHGTQRDQVSYVGGFELAIPRRYLRHNGHVLERIVFQTYEVFKEYRDNSKRVRQDVIDFVFTEHPEILPVEVLAVLRRIEASFGVETGE